MKTKKSLKTKTKIKKINMLFNWVLGKHKDLFLWLFAVCWIALMSIMWNTEWFRASILQIPEKFDWAVMPVSSVPNWAKWWWDNRKTKFYEIDPKNLIDIPPYSISVWWKWPSEIKENTTEKMAKITYAVVYWWNYNIDNRKELSWSHPAVDIVIPVWTPIMSIANGKVVKAVEQSSGFGKHIVVEMPNVPDYPNSNKKTTLYASYSHLNEILVKEWDIVKKWQIIWRSWQSWTSTTPHLHFQIDRDNSQWHPYWPFSSKDAYAANLDFFSAIREWLGQENTIKYTINPMKWVEENLSYNNVANNDNQNVTEWDNFWKFKIVWDDEFSTNSSLTLNIIAEDKDWKVIENFVSSSDISVISSSSNARFSKNLKFSNWVATIIITDRAAEKFDFVVKKWDNEFSKTVKSVEQKKEEVSNTEDLTPQEVVWDAWSWPNVWTVTNEAAKVEVKIEEPKKEEPKKITEKISEESRAIDEKVKIMFSWEKSVQAWDTLIIDVYLNDLNWSFADVVRDYAIDVAWVWDVNQHVLKKEDFVWSKAKLAFKSDVVWSSIVTINGEDFEINVKEKVKDEVAVINKEEVANNWSISDAQDNSQESSSRDSSEDVDNESQNVEKTEEKIFTDLDTNNKNYEAIKYLKNAWVIWWYPDGSFKPNKVVSRVEALKMIFAALKIGLEDKEDLPFTDTDGSAWYADYIWAALAKWIVKWYDDGSFKPSKEVNRAEYYKILLIASWVSLDDDFDAPYDDVPVDSWFGKYFDFVKNNKLSDAEYNIYPNEWVTRSEVAESIYRLIKVLGL